MKSIAHKVLVSFDSKIDENQSESPQTAQADSTIPPKAKVSGSSLVRTDSPGMTREETLRLHIARVTYSKKVKRITLQRYLVSKIVFEQEKVTFNEVLVLYDNMLSLQDLTLKDPNFKKKFSESLLILSTILKGFRFSQLNPNLTTLSEKLKVHLKDFYLPKRNISSVEKHMRGTFHVLPYKSPGIEKSKIPPKPYIGVGYSDKGSRRDVAFDASPTWQEVVNGNPERYSRSENPKGTRTE